MSVKRFDGTSFLDIASPKRYDGQNWIDAVSAKRYDGQNWIETLGPRFRTFRDGVGIDDAWTASNGAWECTISGGSEALPKGGALFLYPRDAFTLPATLEVDWEFSNPSAGSFGGLVAGTFTSEAKLVNTVGGSVATSRVTRTIDLPASPNAYYLGVLLYLGSSPQISAKVYSIKINGVQIPIVGG